MTSAAGPAPEQAETVVATEHGPGRLVSRVPAGATRAVLLSHGAGAGIDTPDLAALATALPGAVPGTAVHLLEQPWRTAGRRVAARPPVLDDGLRAGAAVVRRLQPGVPLVVGGRSAGARSAARCAVALEAAGCLALAFPLHPPGRPERSRLAELREPLRAGVPTLVVQGERDAFGRPEELPDDVPRAVVPDGDHSFKVRRSAPVTPQEALDVLVAAVAGWLAGLPAE